MNWNHRLVLFPDPQTVKVMEVYYDTQGKPWGCNNAAAIHTEHDSDSTTQESIREQLEQMIQATREPILNVATDFTGKAPEPEGETSSLSDLNP
jgi:hypothetical protein